MKTKYIIRRLGSIILFACLVLMMPGCLQKNFDYKPEPINPNINMTVWEFLQSRPVDFSLMSEAISYTGMQHIYSQPSKAYTYLIINNEGMNKFFATYGVTTATSIDIDKVGKFLRYHVIEGQYHAFDKKLPVESIFVKTLLDGEEGLLTIKISKASIGQATNQDQVINGNIVLNETGTNGSSREVLSLTSNVLTTNGAAHVFRNYAVYKRNSTYQSPY